MHKLILRVDRAGEDLLEEWLWIQSAISVSRDPIHVAEPSMSALFDQVTPALIDRALDQAPAELKQAIHSHRWEEIDPNNWQEKWRDAFQPLQAGPFRVVPAWQEGPRDDPHQLRIYPGQAFGTGQHETTQLMLTRLAEHDVKGKRVLDIGCGTGILAIASERLGAAEAFGFDADPDCDENMRYHLQLNNSQRVELAIGVFDDFQCKPYDIILANITLNVLLQIWPKLPAITAPGAVLLNSGILASQQADAIAGLQAAGFQVGEQRCLDEWMLIEARLA